MASPQKSGAVSRRSPERGEIIEGILGSYHATRSWRLFRSGYDVAKTGWLRRFAEDITKEPASLEPWNTLIEKCDTSFMIEHLYVLTFPGKLPGEKRTGANRTFKIQIKKIDRRYDILEDDILG